ncbi:DUF3426 domain-containing protein [Devosia submarina]|uniref:DUF3426 domain-containing protein n=1 Tax=Devosia submarina TaxID=1173082 RepID=UPI000D360A10|nr:DUF3426 domain-containing protein [Devosia submarina]
MIIACPHCQTKYQVTYEAIGSAGRKVQCAQCQQAWQQPPPAQPPGADQININSFVEDGLDEAFLAEEQAVSADRAKRLAEESGKAEAAAKIDPALARNRQRAFTKRQSAIAASQPLAQTRRAVRIGLALLLGIVCAAAFFARVPIVARFPAMAGAYEAIGLPVNVLGLDFTDVETQRSLRNGKDVLIVSAQILGLNAAPTPVPAIVVTLLDSHGQSIYAWSIAPSVSDLMAGERATFDTQLAMPPGDAQRVRLSFADNAPAPAASAAPAHGEPNQQSFYHPAPATAHAAPHATSTPEHH